MREQKVVFIGAGPTTLLSVLHFVRITQCPLLHVIVIADRPAPRFGYGVILDTVHKEVLFNVTASKMYVDDQFPNEFVEFLQNHVRSDLGSLDRILRYNDSADLKDCYVPRHLLQDVVDHVRQRLIDELRSKPRLRFEYIYGEVTDIVDQVGAPGDREVSNSKLKVVFTRLDRTGVRRHDELVADLVVLSIGSPSRTITGETGIAGCDQFARDVNNPPLGHVLHPNTCIESLPDCHHTSLIGIKNSAVDALIVLYERGYFREGTQRKVTVVAESKRFPYPHEREPSGAAGYHSFLTHPSAPAHLINPRTAQDLAGLIVLSCLYASGSTYVGESWTFNPNFDPMNAMVLHRLIGKANSLLQRSKVEPATMVEIFNPNPNEHTWQRAIDTDIRPNIRRFWSNLPEDEKIKWLESVDHDRLYSDLRHRVPAKTLDTVVGLQEAGKVIVVQGRVTNLARTASGKIAAYLNGSDDNFVESDELIKATGWQVRNPIDEIPLLIKMRRNSMLHRHNQVRAGVVVSEHNRHNLRIIGQLTWIINYEISGFQQLRSHAGEEALEMERILRNMQVVDNDH